MNSILDFVHYSDNFLWLMLIIGGVLLYRSVRPICWVIFGAIFSLHFSITTGIPTLYLALLIVLYPNNRKKWLSAFILKKIRQLNLLPKVSETEKTVLESGESWIDADLFSGNPNFKKILSYNYPKLSEEEGRFLNEEVEKLCEICNDYEIYKNKNLSDQAWKFLKENGFFGMIIPKKYGGLEFSAYAHSLVVQKLSSRSIPLGITVMVPNSLGPAELLLHYGTEEQKNYYLPRLANGLEVPCFALTEPNAGSDAASIKAEGVLFKDSNGDLKIKLNFSKRYITLGGVATLIGLAFKLKDPENLLGNGMDIGITCALISSDTLGVSNKMRHNPLNTPFINSPITGKDVVISVDNVIGGVKNVGIGWKMLMECLAAGRGISLPATSNGGMKMMTRITTAYTTIREQFGMPISNFEAIRNVLAKIIANNYIGEATATYTISPIESGKKPAVITAIAKYHMTEMMRESINNAMDVLGGAAIIGGPKNLVAHAYFSTPISITVEGANIVTRGLIHFGQGSMICHKFLIHEIEAITNDDLEKFDKYFFGHLYHFITNKFRAFVLSITCGWSHFPKNRGIIGKYERKIAWLSAIFSYFADLAIIIHGGNLKKKENINGRLGDLLSILYMSTCVLRKYNNDAKPEDILLVKYTMKHLLYKAKLTVKDLIRNIFDNGKWWSPIGKFIMTLIWSPLTNFSAPPSDDLSSKLVEYIIRSDEARNRLTSGVYLSKNPNEQFCKLEKVFLLWNQVNPILKKVKLAIRDGKMEKFDHDLALSHDIITKDELKLLVEYSILQNDVIQVDAYKFEEFEFI